MQLDTERLSKEAEALKGGAAGTAVGFALGGAAGGVIGLAIAAVTGGFAVPLIAAWTEYCAMGAAGVGAISGLAAGKGKLRATVKATSLQKQFEDCITQAWALSHCCSVYDDDQLKQSTAVEGSHEPRLKLLNQARIEKLRKGVYEFIRSKTPIAWPADKEVVKAVSKKLLDEFVG